MARPCPVVERSHSAGGACTLGQEDHRLVATQVALQSKPTVALSRNLRRPSRYTISTTVCRPSLQSAMPPLLSSSFPNWRALSWRLLLPVSLPGLDPGSQGRHGPFFSSSLRQDARVSPPYENAAATFSAWPSQPGTGTDRIIDYHHQCASLTTRWPSQLVPRPVVDRAGVPATEPSRVAELMGELYSTEFGHRAKIDSLDDRSLSSPHREGQSPVEVPVEAALEPLTGLLKMGKATRPDSVPNEIL